MFIIQFHTSTSATNWNVFLNFEPILNAILNQNMQVATKSADILQQADIRMRLHGLQKLVNDKSVASGLSKLVINRTLTRLLQLNEIDKLITTC